MEKETVPGEAPHRRAPLLMPATTDADSCPQLTAPHKWTKSSAGGPTKIQFSGGSV